MPGALERYRLPQDVRERLEELRDLSEKAENGEKGARKQLKAKLWESSAEVVARASDVDRRAQHVLIETASAGDPLTEYALSGRLDMMREEIAGEDPTPLEVLLSEQVASCWLWLQLHEVLISAQFSDRKEARAHSVSPSLPPAHGSRPTAPVRRSWGGLPEVAEQTSAHRGWKLSPEDLYRQGLVRTTLRRECEVRVLVLVLSELRGLLLTFEGTPTGGSWTTPYGGRALQTREVRRSHLRGMALAQAPAGTPSPWLPHHYNPACISPAGVTPTPLLIGTRMASKGFHPRS